VVVVVAVVVVVVLSSGYCSGRAHARSVIGCGGGCGHGSSSSTFENTPKICF